MSPLSLGRIFYLCYHAPKGFVSRSLKNGIAESIRTSRGKKQMEKAAYELPEQRHLPIKEMPVTLCFLTGEKYIEQTLFCLHSLQHYSGTRLPVTIYSDGSLTKNHIQEIKRITGCEHFITAEQANQKLIESVPMDKYAALHQRRAEYPHLKKLTDIHAGKTGWRLVLDSDMIFFSKPDQLLKWCEEPPAPLHMIDSETSYGYDKCLMQKLCGGPVDDRVNVGVIGLQSHEIDWAKLDGWIAELQREAGTSYFQEQALVAMMLASQESRKLNEQQYKCLPAESDLKNIVCGHFVAESKNLYFQQAWRFYLETIQ